jgi:hypothetical protein
MPVMAEATTEKEPADEEAECKSLPSLRASSFAGAPSPVQVFGAAQLLSFCALSSLKKPLARSDDPLVCLHRCGMADPYRGHRQEPRKRMTRLSRMPMYVNTGLHSTEVSRASGRKGDAMAQQEFLFQQLHETCDEGGLEMTLFAHVRIAHEDENGVMVYGIAVETLPQGLQVRCIEALERYRMATSQQPSWLFIHSAEQKIVVR